MSNSIWKTDNLQEADTRKQILFYAGGSTFPYLGWHYPNKGFDTWNYEDVQKWAYLEDVLAQADKAERLQKAVDLALNVMGGLKSALTHTEHTSVAEALAADINEIELLIQNKQK